MKISDISEAFRLAMVQVLVPELKELRIEMNQRFELLHKEMHERFAKADEKFESLHKEMHDRFAKADEKFEVLHKEMHERFAKADEKFDKMMGILTEMKGDIKQLQARDEINMWILKRVGKLEDDMDKVKLKLAA